MTISVASAVRSPDGSVIITGTEFTKTTTTVYIDGVSTPFLWVSAEQLSVSGVADDAIEATVEKGGVEESAEITDDEEEATVPETPAPTETPEVPAESAITAGTWPSPIDAYRTAVHGVALVGLIPVGDEKTPYPTGTQLAAGSKFWLRNGYYKSATPT